MPSLSEHRRRDAAANAVLKALWPNEWRQVAADLVAARCWQPVCDLAVHAPLADRDALIVEWAAIAYAYCRRGRP